MLYDSNFPVEVSYASIFIISVSSFHFLLYKTAVAKDAGSITISCRFPTKLPSTPIWYPQSGLGVYGPVEPFIGKHSSSETIDDLEWRLTVGVSEDGPLRLGSQTPVHCYSLDTGVRGRFQIDVVGKPFSAIL